jgi:P4 family phage/plasmid primase-like protien
MVQAEEQTRAMMTTTQEAPSQHPEGIADGLPDIRECARGYIERGYAVCRLLPGEKNPSYRKWNRSSLQPEDFENGDNIGIITGRLSDDLVCVDLDDAEVLRRADEFLPPTAAEEGRPGNPRSHRWYRVTDIPPELASRKASGGIGGPWLKHLKHGQTGENLVDFLGTGGQAAVPPSLHHSGARRVWDNDGEPACVPMVQLWSAVCRLAQACGWEPKTKAGKKGRGRETKPPQERREPSAEAVASHDLDLLPLPERVEKARRYLEKVDLARSGHGGHDTTYRVARLLTNDFALPEETARTLLNQYNDGLAEAGEETWTEDELDHKLQSSGGNNLEYPYGCKALSRPESPANDPFRLADEFIAADRWVFWNGLYFQYDGTRYLERSETDVRALLAAHIESRLLVEYRRQVARSRQDDDSRKPRKSGVSCGLVSSTLQALGGRTLRLGVLPMPGWLTDRAEGSVLGFHNGLLDIDQGELWPHTPDWFSSVCLPYDHDPAASCPRWLAVLGQNLEGDVERISLLQEFFGYTLLNSTDAQKFIFLVGEGANGKSVVLAGLHAMLGQDNVSTVPLEKFGERFAMAQTLGKLVNVCPEVGELDKTAEGTLKSFVSGDRMTFEKKGIDAFSARPTARLVLSTNNVPRFSDRSEGVWRRLLLVPFNRQVPVGERVAGMDKPEFWLGAGEVPGILNWALEGLKRLKANGMQFTDPAVCRAALHEHRADSDPCRAFLEEHYAVEPDAPPLPAACLYQEFRGWCEQNGYNHIPTANAFGRQVRRVFGLQSAATSIRIMGEPTKAWVGLARKPTPECNLLPIGDRSSPECVTL